MRRLRPLGPLGFLMSACCAAAVAAPTASILTIDSPASVSAPGSGGGVERDGPRDCGVVSMHADDVYYAAFAWSGDGSAPPYYGAFAECYDVPGPICGIVLDLTQNGGQAGQTCDLYVWADDNGAPGPVLAMRSGVDPGPIAPWPEVSRHILSIPEITPDGPYWVGFWGNWAGAPAGWYVGADGSSFENGCPRTNIAPGQEHPKGWTDVKVPFLPADALGIGVQIAVDEAIGACCLLDESCTVEVESQCTQLGGSFQGSGVPCTPELCLFPTGACCLGQNCFVVTFDDCFQHDGRYIGDGSDCQPNPCGSAGVDEDLPQDRYRSASWGRIKSILR
jgi:hypothetical protein